MKIWFRIALTAVVFLVATASFTHGAARVVFVSAAAAMVVVAWAPDLAAALKRRR